MPDRPLHADAIRQHLAEVADELPPDGPRRTIVLVGGALMALLGLRPATRDVDTVERLDEPTKEAVATVARRHGLAPRWLNDSAAAFRPSGFDVATCRVLLDRSTLLVLGAPADQVFLMKLNAARAVDTADLRALWPLCTFESPQAAVEAFYAAYPLEAEDDNLADFIDSLLET